MGRVDPTDAAAVGDALAGWAAARFGGEVHLAEPPAAIAGGFDSHLHAVRLHGGSLPEAWLGPLVVRLLPTADRRDQAEQEAAVQRWAVEQGYHAPEVLAVVDPDDGFGLPAQVMERLPGTTMLDAAASRPWTALRMVDQLAGLAVRLHGLRADGWPGPTTHDDLVSHRLGLPRRVVEGIGDERLARVLARVEAEVVPTLTGGATVVCHGDFHPLNVMVDGDRAWVLDWTDAGLGPPESDVARTLLLLGIVAPIAASSRIERAALRLAGPRLATRYRRAYERHGSLDPSLLRGWDALHAMHGWAQVVALHAGAFAGESSAEDRQADIPLAVGETLAARVDAALAG